VPATISRGFRFAQFGLRLLYRAALGASVCMNREDAMTKEDVERLWFVRFVTALMICALAVGAVPILKNTFFPSQQARR
jgi:hypothetical protein